MNLSEVIRVALRALGRNKMRTLLTMLGIIIGVGAVICTVAIGQGAGAQVQEQIKNLGTNLIVVFAGSVNSGGVRMGSQATKTLTADDAQAIEQHIPSIVAVSPGVGAAVQIVNGNQNWATRATGASAAFFDIRSWPVVEGSAFSERDVVEAADVCVIGKTVAEQLFGDQDPVGQLIRVQKLPFRIIGLLAAKGQNSFGQDQDDTLVIPYTTVQKKIAGIDWVQMISASVDSEREIPLAQKQVAALLRQRHHLRSSEDDDFIIRSPDELAQASAATSQILTLLLSSIASVSLVVGGIGIMNIMLVSVTERTREIGVRMAVGATESDVQRQFMSEALVLSSLGGLIGIILGIVGSVVVSNVFHWKTIVSPVAVLVAALFSAAVGIFFGYYPARKAARLDPIEALRYE
ncbi:MAG TPA: ABC transporter permease [Verrucomicrobiae bacterium]|jgi:putative ABC transport system permease protein|nr:ABC transporter permease [Verrucomicrobiae bacterium]